MSDTRLKTRTREDQYGLQWDVSTINGRRVLSRPLGNGLPLLFLLARRGNRWELLVVDRRGVVRQKDGRPARQIVASDRAGFQSAKMADEQHARDLDRIFDAWGDSYARTGYARTSNTSQWWFDESQYMESRAPW